MTRSRTLVLGTGVLAASILGIGTYLGASAIAQPQNQPQPNTRAAQPVRLATVDVFALGERMMQDPALAKVREDTDAGWKPRLEEIEKNASEIDEKLRTMPQNAQDPQVQQMLQQRQTLVNNYQQLLQERQEQLETLNSQQLIDIYNRIRSAVDAVAARNGYTHVINSRLRDRAIQPQTVSDTVQEIIARPVVVSPQEDDLTQLVVAELKLPDLAVPAETPAGAAGQD